MIYTESWFAGKSWFTRKACLVFYRRFTVLLRLPLIDYESRVALDLQQIDLIYTSALLVYRRDMSGLC